MKLSPLFSTWPFSVVPSRDSDVVWAGRPALRDQVLGLLNSFSYRPQSTLDLVWASFGSGKTHLLYFLEQQALMSNAVVPWYTVVPNRPKSFSDVYQSLMSSFPIEYLSSAAVNAHNRHSTEIDPVLRAISIGTEDQKRVATDWLLGRRVDMRSAPRLVPLPYKLDSTTSMQRVLGHLVHVLASEQSRFLLLLDEYQRTRNYKSPIREVVHATVVDCFNATPRGLSVVFSCSAVQQAAALGMFPPELTDRLRGRRLIALPEMSELEALEFVTDLLAAWRPPEYKGHALAPFPTEGLGAVFQAILAASDLRLIPRHIIQVLDLALSDAVAKGGDAVRHADLLEAVRLVQQLTADK